MSTTSSRDWSRRSSPITSSSEAGMPTRSRNFPKRRAWERMRTPSWVVSGFGGWHLPETKSKPWVELLLVTHRRHGGHVLPHSSHQHADNEHQLFDDSAL